MKRLLLFLLLLIAAFGCSPSHERPQVEGFEVPQKLVESVSFNELFNNVFEPSCIGCHGSQNEVNLESADTARKALRKITNAVLIKRSMPKAPYTSLSDQQLQLIAAWVKAGGPDAPLDGSQAQERTTLEPTYNSIRKKILKPRCFVCHGPGGEAHRVSLDSAQEMIDSPLEIVIPGVPEESGLMLVTRSSARKRMPPKETEIGPLTLAEIQVIETWIAAGAAQ